MTLKSDWIWYVVAAVAAFYLYEKAMAQAQENKLVNMGEGLAQTLIDDAF